MAPEARDLAWARAQLTAARWHLDAVVSADARAARDHHERARQSCDGIEHALAQLDIPAEDRKKLERELTALRLRLEAWQEPP